MAGAASAISRDAIAERLAEARERTLALVEPLDEEQLNTVYTPILSPLAWDLGHIANFEELWLVQRLGDLEPLDGDLARLYDAIENPRAGRNELPILRGEDLRTYMAEVRGRTLQVLERVEPGDGDDPLLHDGFLYEMLIAHEHQHNETMLQLLQMVDGYEPVTADPTSSAEPVAPGPEMVEVPAGEYAIGAAQEGFAYDNERPRHDVELAGFLIDRAPVSNAAFADFVAATGAEPPMYWERDGEGGWISTVFGRREKVDPDLPVVHVDHGQATAFAAWAGKRLPTELEWEAAAAGADRDRANLDHLAFGPSPAGAYADAPSDHGAVQMLGDVWEWTDSTLSGYPGFSAFPYPEYSEVFFADAYPVLRGGSWATRRNVIRTTFRNWDLAERRQIFAGIRCAKEV
ncbi:MAG: SUMF1/EgtB/PvdO family nonheme iron enzyme [Solirubrobacterales bacterium]